MTTTRRVGSNQLRLPGLLDSTPSWTVPTCCHVAPGQQVVYMGRLRRGPRHGSRGTVKQALRRQAIVDMGPDGTWHIPYYFLSLPPRAP